MTPEEFRNNLDRAIDKTAEEMKEVMQVAAVSAKNILKTRIQNKGLNRQYSRNPLPIFFFNGRALNAGGRALLQKKKKLGEGISYEEWRKAQGLPVDKVNLTYTGKMFGGWNQPGSERKGLVIRGFVGGINKEVRDKLKWNKSRFPDFDKPTPEEKKFIKENLVAPRLKELLQKNLFNR
ncbi:hypothetical protein C7S20_19470 [Christiangramia fulva]|uniref:Phage morphogenesis protein n=1 Tax=Christiangramia fulva TaxID=2126553 RepID=A0A2R3ZAF7_9FLAO|nr:hypothetical protein [Christiangramia fulva]AVR47256.1 hypothetical protein C7S20_19470 [Christiangramia fulva]